MGEEHVMFPVLNEVQKKVKKKKRVVSAVGCLLPESHVHRGRDGRAPQMVTRRTDAHERFFTPRRADADTLLQGQHFIQLSP